MCIEKLNTPKKHQELVGKLTFPVTMYKVVSLRNNHVGPAYGRIGETELSEQKKFNMCIGKNHAIENTIYVGRKKSYTSGFHIFKRKIDAERLLELFNKIENSGKQSVMPVIVEKPEHLTCSGMETPRVSVYFREATGDTKKTVYVASEIEIDKEDYKKALNNENS